MGEAQGMGGALLAMISDYTDSTKQNDAGMKRRNRVVLF